MEEGGGVSGTWVRYFALRCWYSPDARGRLCKGNFIQWRIWRSREETQGECKNITLVVTVRSAGEGRCKGNSGHTNWVEEMKMQRRQILKWNPLLNESSNCTSVTNYFNTCKNVSFVIEAFILELEAVFNFKFLSSCNKMLQCVETSCLFVTGS